MVARPVKVKAPDALSTVHLADILIMEDHVVEPLSPVEESISLKYFLGKMTGFAC